MAFHESLSVFLTKESPSSYYRKFLLHSPALIFAKVRDFFRYSTTLQHWTASLPSSIGRHSPNFMVFEICLPLRWPWLHVLPKVGRDGRLFPMKSWKMILRGLGDKPRNLFGFSLCFRQCLHLVRRILPEEAPYCMYSTPDGCMHPVLSGVKCRWQVADLWRFQR